MAHMCPDCAERPLMYLAHPHLGIDFYLCAHISKLFLPFSNLLTYSRDIPPAVFVTVLCIFPSLSSASCKQQDCDPDLEWSLCSALRKWNACRKFLGLLLTKLSLNLRPPCVGEGRGLIHGTTPESRNRGIWKPKQSTFLVLNSCFLRFLYPQWFSYCAFFTLPIQAYVSKCPQPAKNQLFPFCLFLLLPTSKMLEWELGWPLCWWQMKEKQTQLACLQLQWFSRAGSSKDMLFVDKTHSTKLWGGAETVSQCPACTFGNPSFLCWLSLEKS